MEQGKRATEILSLLEFLSMSTSAPSTEDKSFNSSQENNKQRHDFWSTQPVPQSRSELTSIDEDGPITLLDKEKLRKEPYEVLSEDGGVYKFSSFDINSETHLKELYVLLCENYVEDYDSLFRFEYSEEFLKWALMAPGWKPEWHVSVRDGGGNGKLMAFISAVPCKFRIRANSIESVEVNFLCIEKSLRNKRLAPLLIKEVTRRVNLDGIFQALYTAGISLPEPIGTAQYYHRPLNFSKLLTCNFTYLPPNRTVAQMENYYKLPAKAAFTTRPLCLEDLPLVCELLELYLKKFALAHQLNLEECAHWLLPRKDVVYSFVVLDEDEKIVDFFSLYSIPSSILNQPEIPFKSIQVAYLFYYSVSSEIRLLPLIKTVLQEASKLGFDVLNCLNLMDNQDSVLDALKFGAGDGQLRYYLYNWKTKSVKPSEIGFVML